MRYINIKEIEEKYKGARWRKTRKAKLRLNPFCERCFYKGIYTPAFIVHHKEYINDKNYIDDDVFFNLDNLESLCLPCHNKEHFREEEDFCFDEDGNVVKKD